MTVQVSYPGVYIDEFTPGAPIQGVGTNTAAFIGIAERGPLDTPTKLTSWEQFKSTFGSLPAPGWFLWYAVRGFFENGGRVCYVVRASNGTYGELDLENRATSPAFVVRARQPGAIAISIEIAEHHTLAAADTVLYQPTGLLAAQLERELTMQAEGVTPAEHVAGRFRPGDVITLSGGTEEIAVVAVSGAVVRLAAKPLLAYPVGTTVRLANSQPGATTIRLQYNPGPVPAGALVRGTILTVTQAGSMSEVVESVKTEFLPDGSQTSRVTFRRGLPQALSMDPADPATIQSEEIDVTVQTGATASYGALGWDSTHPRYYRKIINDDPNAVVRIDPLEPPPPDALPLSLPANLAPTPLVPGAPEDLTALSDQDFIDALETLAGVDDVNLVACPDRITDAVQQSIIAHCELLADRFAVLDAQAALPPFGVGSIETQRQAVTSTRGYAALYYPWLRVLPTHGDEPVLVPPSGHVAGIIARSDNARGVHKAPANEIVNGALGVETAVTDVDQGQLNLQGVNVVRVFRGGRPILWGARTTASDTNWMYVNVRRLFLFVEESIEEGIRWALFEPNDLALWKKLKRTLTEFLVRVWRDGGLFGAKQDDAFYVRIDEELNPFSEQALGRLNIEIGLRPTYPAEFIIVRIGIWPGGAAITE